MTYEEILSLGWTDRHDKKKEVNNTFWINDAIGNRFIMGTIFEKDEDFVQVMIKLVDSNCNEWENSECHFYGFLKTIDDLKTVMRFIEIIKY